MWLGWAAMSSKNDITVEVYKILLGNMEGFLTKELGKLWKAITGLRGVIFPGENSFTKKY